MRLKFSSSILAVLSGAIVLAALVGRAVGGTALPGGPISSAKASFEQADAAQRAFESAMPRASKPAALATPNGALRNFPPLGIFEMAGTPVRGVHVTNTANVQSSSGGIFTLYAGSVITDDTQGVIIVLDRNHDDGSIERAFRLAPGLGAATLTGIDGDQVAFKTARGITGYFDFLAGTFR